MMCGTVKGESMVDEKDKEQVQERGGWSLLRILWVLGVVLALYVLSTGPVLKWSDTRRGRNKVILIYYPLIVLGHHVPAAERFLDWYVNELWKAQK